MRRLLVLETALLFAFSTLAHAATFTVTNTGSSGAGSFTQAIIDANAAAGADTINFNVIGAGPHVFISDLPAITGPVTINGYSEPGSVENTAPGNGMNAELKIILDGASLPDGEAVLEIEASGTVVRGVAIRSIRSTSSGIAVAQGLIKVSIRGCQIGVSAGGTLDSSAGTGIRVEGSASIGGSTLADINLISGNNVAGIELRGSSSTVRNNLIGTNDEGAPTIGNGVGILLATAAASDNSITTNLIAGNSSDGIRLESTAGDGNRFERNRIRDNGGLGIDLGGDGVTPNDADDSDAGPNRRQNFPELSLARLNKVPVNEGLLRVAGFLRGAPGTYAIELFENDDADPSGFGEGGGRNFAFEVEILVGQALAEFTQVIDIGTIPPQPHPFLVATARNVATGDTSEFSRVVDVLVGGEELEVTNTSDSGAGSLRAAVDASNQLADPNTIVFNIAGDGPHVITPQGGYFLEDPVIIDGYSQPLSALNTLSQGSNADLRIVVDGSALPEQSPAAFRVFASDVAIRGLAIHSAPQDAIDMAGADAARVEGCFIGTDAGGETSLGNGKTGITTGDVTNVLVGGPTAGQRNVIVANATDGIAALSDGARILNNLIGVSASMAVDLGNGRDGVTVSGTDSLIGSDEPELGNVIRGNARSGIGLVSNAAGNTILGNSIGVNAGLAIDLAGEFGPLVTLNDADDADTGPNAKQNFPVLLAAKGANGLVKLKGSLDVPAATQNATYTIRVFANQACDPFGNGEGEAFLAARDVLLSGDDEIFTISFPTDLDGSVRLTATATDTALGNTSEFSECLTVGEDVVACGDVNLDETVSAADALTTLKAAVGTAQCELCVCDVDHSGAILSSDALLVLQKGVGQSIDLACPVCD